MAGTVVKAFVNGKMVDITLTPEEVSAMEREQERQEAEYWQNVSEGEAVNAEIRKRYSVDEELAILRQMVGNLLGDKPRGEHDEYFSYCESSREHVRDRMRKHRGGKQ